MEYNGKALADLVDPKDKTKVLVKAGEQLWPVSASARRRFNRVRLLDLFRVLGPGRQPDGAT